MNFLLKDISLAALVMRETEYKLISMGHLFGVLFVFKKHKFNNSLYVRLITL